MLSKSYASAVNHAIVDSIICHLLIWDCFFPFGTTTSKQIQLRDQWMDGREDDRRFPLFQDGSHISLPLS